MLGWLLWWRLPCVRKTVIANLGPDEAIRGVLWAVNGPWLTLKDASALASNTPAQRIDGDVVVHRSKVLFLQVLPE